ncbi:methionine aminopeptidase [Metabacillus litoralis]|uniref:methionine aminopeptidase n=1 Tax=Metabacillus litoralis TaxID=152268 RepID=UPI001CFF1674|nr:methionine aminopeptidase [Metabacillus litoralis]
MKVKSLLFSWFNKRKLKYHNQMKKINKCPECRGHGFIITSSTYLANSLECYACNSTGRYSEWEQENSDQS